MFLVPDFFFPNFTFSPAFKISHFLSLYLVPKANTFFLLYIYQSFGGILKRYKDH